jgi:hypothetical protein
MTVTPSTLIAVGLAVGVLFLVQGWILWRLLGAVAVVQRMDEKLAHFGDALTLLTETAEGGFRAVASELDRAGLQAATTGVKKPVLPKPTSARMTAAAKRGRSVEEIASTEQVSEGEVRLRLHLAKQAAAAKANRTKKGRTDAASLAQTTQVQEPKNGALRA